MAKKSRSKAIGVMIPIAAVILLSWILVYFSDSTAIGDTVSIRLIVGAADIVLIFIGLAVCRRKRKETHSQDVPDMNASEGESEQMKTVSHAPAHKPDEETGTEYGRLPAGERVLVASSEFGVCGSIIKMLENTGVRTEWTLSGREAVFKAEQSVSMNDSFGAYIIGSQLSDMSGPHAAEQIRSVDSHGAIVFLTTADIECLTQGTGASDNVPILSAQPVMKKLTDAMEEMSHRGADIQKKEVGPQFPDEGRKRVLVVDDNEMNQEIEVDMLCELGYDTACASNGREAVELIAAAEYGDYDLILMDIKMPVMDGYEASRQIRSMKYSPLRDIPILATSANVFDEDRRLSQLSGMNGFVSKPIDFEEFDKTLKRFLKK